MIQNKNRLLVVIVNYGSEQIEYLEKVVSELKKFKKYQVTIIVNSNINLDIVGIDTQNVFRLDDYQLLPLTCRKTIWDNKDNYDYFIYSENDHLFLEKHLDKHIEYSAYLPENRICGLIQYEEDESGKYYPGFHIPFNWDFKSVESYNGKKFAHFNNVHQASFILTKSQLLRIGEKIDFISLVNEEEKKYIVLAKKVIRKIIGLDYIHKKKYSVKCKVNTDIYNFGGMKKVICISDFEENLIHHLPNLYIEGSEGRRKLRADSKRMNDSINQLLGNK